MWEKDQHVVEGGETGRGRRGGEGRMSESYDEHDAEEEAQTLHCFCLPATLPTPRSVVVPPLWTHVSIPAHHSLPEVNP